MPPSDVLAALPVFPLPNVVFFPGMVLPLNVFEQRYLDLVDHVLEHGRHIGVPLMSQGGPEIKNRPHEPIFGVGRLVSHTRLPDGRRFIRLQGLGRVRELKALPEQHLFREVSVEPLPEQTDVDRIKYEQLVAQIERLSGVFDSDERALAESILEIDEPRVAVYALAALLSNVDALRDESLLERSHECVMCPILGFQQCCLEATTVTQRVHLLLERTDFLIRELSSEGRLGRGCLH